MLKMFKMLKLYRHIFEYLDELLALGAAMIDTGEGKLHCPNCRLQPPKKVLSPDPQDGALKPAATSPPSPARTL